MYPQIIFFTKNRTTLSHGDNADFPSIFTKLLLTFLGHQFFKITIHEAPNKPQRKPFQRNPSITPVARPSDEPSLMNSSLTTTQNPSTHPHHFTYPIYKLLFSVLEWVQQLNYPSPTPNCIRSSCSSAKALATGTFQSFSPSSSSSLQLPPLPTLPLSSLLSLWLPPFPLLLSLQHFVCLVLV